MARYRSQLRPFRLGQGKSFYARKRPQCDLPPLLLQIAGHCVTGNAFVRDHLRVIKLRPSGLRNSALNLAALDELRD